MSSESPKPPLPDTVRKTTEELAKFVQWIAELIRRRNWFTLLLLIDVALILFCTPGGIVPQFLKSAFSIELPGWYGKAFWLAVAGIFLAALIIAVVTMPSEMEEDTFQERKAIKGLRPFTRGDAEIFSRLQRQRDVEDCLHSLKSSSFRFGYLVGESGCGKTSFLQAGLLPKLEEAIAACGVYIRFSDRDPLETVRKAIGEQLSLESLSNGEKESFLAVVKEAVAATSKPLILLFDQFEQFFVQCKYESDRQPFIQALKEWYESPEKPPVKIIFSIRADLYYYLIEIEQALAYNPSPFEVCCLKKFSPQQATEVLATIAETEKLEFDRAFIEKMSQQELASREDGLISPVDLQILAWMLERENMEQLRAFNEKAFQQLGGIEGLLKRYLEKVLETRTLASQRQATIEVLLALTDLERQVRGGVLTVAELREKLKETVQPREVAEATVWLARGEVRLISAVEREGMTGYELAHERMIPALMQLSGKELTAADRANKLLDARVNEWLGSNSKSRYLLDIWELWAIERQKPYLIWGAKREQKERLLRLSKRRIYGVTGAVATVILVVVLFSGWLFFTPQGQIQQVRWAISNPLGSSLARVSDWSSARVALALAKDEQWQVAFKLAIDHVNHPEDKAYFLSQFAAIAPRKKDSSQAETQLEKALAEAKKIDALSHKSFVLSRIALAYRQLENEQAAKALLQDSLVVAEKIDNPSHKSSALDHIFWVIGQLENEQAAKALLQDSLAVLEKVDDSFYQSYALSGIASASSNFKNKKTTQEFLNASLNLANKINDPSSKSYALNDIAWASGKLKDEKIAKEILQALLNSANKIDEPYFQSSVLSWIAGTYIQLKNENVAKEILQASLDLIDRIDEPYSKSHALGIITSIFEKFNNKKIAKEILQALLNSANKIDEPYSKSYALSEITSIFGQLKNENIAKELLQASLDSADKIDDPYSKSFSAFNPYSQPYAFNQYSKSYALSRIAWAYVQLRDEKAAKELLQASLDAVQKSDDSYSKSYALSGIASTSGNLKDKKVANELLQASLDAAKNIDDPYNQSDALSAIALASGSLTNWETTQAILRDTLSVAEAANAAFALKEISFQYALHEDWGKALRALRNCPESQKIEALAQILTLWAEKKNPQFIDGAVVLKAPKVEGTANNYTFHVSLYSRDLGCNQYADWWEVLGEDGELLYRHVFNQSHPDEQPFTSSQEPVKITEDKTVIVRAHMNNTGYKAMQAWKGSVKNGFKFVRLSENFAARVAKEEPQPPECQELD